MHAFLRQKQGFMPTQFKRYLLASARIAVTALHSLALGAGLIVVASPPANAVSADTKPTVVLVHGAFAESMSWDDVVGRLLAKGYPVVTAPNPLRGVASLLTSIAAPIVLVGHSYGGTVITTAATGKPNMKARVYVAAFAPDTGESAVALAGKHPVSTLGLTSRLLTTIRSRAR